MLQQLIFPRLEAEVEIWNPREDFMPVHAWLHPWLPFLKSRLESLYPQIRYKLGSCLQAWHPSDSSAKAMIAPWRDVFAAVDMNTFLARFISPKLTMCMKEFVINPSNQSMQLFDWVMAWRDLLPLSDLAQILEQFFFPKFLAVLCEWLSSPTANFMAISQWYTFWKQRFDSEILAVTSVKANFKRALDIMNRAVSGEAPVAEPAQPSRTSAVSQAPPPSLLSQFAAERSIDLKHLVQQLADDNNILYMPKPGRSADGKALFTFGKLQLYIERDVIFVKEKASPSFRPVSLQDLVQLSQ
jgi:tuftelin-interacting protein 11